MSFEQPFFASSIPSIAAEAWSGSLWCENNIKVLLSPLNLTRGSWGHGRMATVQAGKEKPLWEKLSGLCLHRGKVCEKKKWAFDWLIKNEVKSLCWWTKPCVHQEWKQSFLPSVFLPKEWKFPGFPPWQPSILALTHYTCVRALTSINPLLTGNQTYPVDAGLLGLSLFSP